MILDNNEAIMIQSVFGTTTLTSVEKTMSYTEIICIGKQAILIIETAKSYTFNHVYS